MIKEHNSDYLKVHAQKKQSAGTAFIALVLFVFIGLMIIAKIALSSSPEPEFSSEGPKSDDVFVVAKEFVKPTLKSEYAEFADDKYQFAKQADSVYVIKSSANSKTVDGDEITTNFKVVLKYKGGLANRKKNWGLIDISENR